MSRHFITAVLLLGALALALYGAWILGLLAGAVGIGFELSSRGAARVRLSDEFPGRFDADRERRAKSENR